jgi:NAD(P)-dependent dehydrogenase (short-subunit alcohol dehydrogenase family)
MTLVGKKVVVVGGSSGIGLSTAEMAKREGADVIIASRNVERLDKAAEKLNAIAIPADVTSDDSIADLFRRCGPVDHVVVTAAQLRTGPFKTVAMEDVRGTMEGKFWGAWRVAQQAQIRAGGSLTLVSGFLSVRPRPNSAIVSAANGALESLGKGARARTGACARELCFAWDYRHADPCSDAGRGAARHAVEDGCGAAGRPRRSR